jgi:hypothetical protein
MLRKLIERLRGSSRAPEDLAVGTTRPGDFADDPVDAEEHGGALEPNPRDEENRPEPGEERP